MSHKLVSVISPCYNVAPYISRLLDSLISQTYKKLEVILVNDGSTDNTGEIIEGYIPKLEAEGYKVLYIVQENGGQSSAVNNALKLVTGQFLTWPDPDDWLTPDSIEKRVDFLKSHPDVGLVRCNAELIEEDTHCSLGLLESGCIEAQEIDDFFNKLIYTRTWYAPVASMVRMEYLDKVIPDREIYVEKRAGQNWQMMLPMAQKYPSWQLPDLLAYYLVRKDSHSHSAETAEEIIAYSEMSERVLCATLARINAPTHILSSVHEKYALHRFEISVLHHPFFKRFSYYKKAICVADTCTKKMRLSLRVIIPRVLH